MRNVLLIATAALGALCLSTQLPAQFREPDAEGPFPAHLVRAIEGDLYELNFVRGPGSGRVRFRLSNANTPSPHGDKACERSFGVEVRDYVDSLLRGRQFRTHNIRRGRTAIDPRVGQIELDGEDLGEHLIARGMAVAYRESRRNPERRVWHCEDPPVSEAGEPPLLLQSE